MEPVGGYMPEPVDIGKIPGVEKGLDYATEAVGKAYMSVMDVLAPYQSIGPLKVLILLYLVKFLVTLPLANVFQVEKDVCYNTTKLCGNTFNTFYTILKIFISLMIFIFYVRVMAGGFKESGFFSLRAFLPIATTLVIVFLTRWLFQATTFTSPGATFVPANATQNKFYTLYQLIRVHTTENIDALTEQLGFSSGGGLGAFYAALAGQEGGNTNEAAIISSLSLGSVPTTLFVIVTLAAVLTLAGKL